MGTRTRRRARVHPGREDGRSRWASADDWAVGKMRNVGQEILRRRNILKAFGSPSIMPSEALLTTSATIADDDARLRRALARVDAEMARRHGWRRLLRRRQRVKKQQPEPRPLGPRGQRRGDRGAEGLPSGRRGRALGGRGVSRRSERRNDDKTRRLKLYWLRSARGSCRSSGRPGFGCGRRQYRVASRKAFEAAQAASDQATTSVAQLDIRNVKDQCSGSANALDADKAAQAAQAALDAEAEARSSTGGGEGVSKPRAGPPRRREARSCEEEEGLVW